MLESIVRPTQMNANQIHVRMVEPAVTELTPTGAHVYQVTRVKTVRSTLTNVLLIPVRMVQLVLTGYCPSNVGAPSVMVGVCAILVSTLIS